MSNPPDTINAVERWLQAPPPESPFEEIEALRSHLLALGDLRAPPGVVLRVIEGLHVRAQSAIEAIAPKLYSVKLPVSLNTRQTVRFMQDALEALIRLSLDLAEAPDSQLVKGLGTPVDIAIWRILHAIGRQILLSDLTASPVAPGTWLSLHRAYLAARRHRVENRVPTGAQYSLQSLYARISLLGALPVSALSAQEWSCAYRLALRVPFEAVVTDSEPDADQGAILWITPELDNPPVHFDRKAPTEGALTLFILYRGLDDAFSRLIAPVQGGRPAAGLLPDDISPRTAAIAMKRIRDYLRSPKKRRFPRRRQGYRATLSFGLPDTVHLLKTRSDSEIDLSEWMIVNESPGGYAAMHVSGKPRKVQVGDLIGLLREGSRDWSICIVRWALSENHEHLELGLQEVSPKVTYARLATPGHVGAEELPALLLPAFPPLRTADAIAFAPGHRPADGHKHLIVIGGTSTQVREFKLGETLEQSLDVEIALISYDVPI